MKKILILHTGGTIGMMSRSSLKTGKTLIPSKLGTHFLELVPELAKLATIKLEVLDNIDSSDVTPRHWFRWFSHLKKQYGRYDGFVFTHGTDTMAYSASALSFALQRVSKPIVFTGSQRPLMNIRTDARDNLINAVEMAVNGPAEVSLCFSNRLLRANRSIKFSSSDFVAFESFNFPDLATLGVEIEASWLNLTPQQKVKAGSPSWNLNFDESVFSFKVFPGISTEVLKAAITAPASRGIVLEAFGSGNIPMLSKSVLNMIELASQNGKPVVIVSQCPHGRVDLELYESGERAKRLGAISAGDMTREAVIVKLMHALGQKWPRQKIVRYLESNICGERTN